MDYALFASLFTLSLLFGMLLCLEVGRRIGLRRRAKAAGGAVAGSGAMEGAVFALLGLLVAFSFSGAATRFDARRQLIVEETNAVGTAYLRLDLLPSGGAADAAGAFPAVPGDTPGRVSQAVRRCRSARGPAAVGTIAGRNLDPGSRRVAPAGRTS